MGYLIVGLAVLACCDQLKLRVARLPFMVAFVCQSVTVNAGIIRSLKASLRLKALKDDARGCRTPAKTEDARL